MISSIALLTAMTQTTDLQGNFAPTTPTATQLAGDLFQSQVLQEMGSDDGAEVMEIEAEPTMDDVWIESGATE